MKIFFFAAVGLVIGFVMGGVGPKSELAAMQATLDRLQVELTMAQQSQPSSRPALPVPGMRAMFENNTGEADRQRNETDPDRGDEPDLTVIEDSGLIEQPPEPQDLVAEFDIAVSAQRLRAEQSRMALQEQADLTDDDMAEFDTIIFDMNERLSDYGDIMMDMALAGAEPDPEEMLGLTHDVTGVLYDAQSSLNDLVGDDSMADVDLSSQQVWNHVDLEVFRDAVEMNQ